MLKQTKQQPPAQLNKLERAIWRTIAYVDGFDYPLTAVEIQRYLEKSNASLTMVQKALANNTYWGQKNGYYTLPNREEIVEIRQQRARRAQALWPPAVRYGRLIAHIPFVRMVAITGSLAMNNITDDADVDYLVVTENGRLWLSRALIIAIVRLAARQKIILCPNYLISQNNLHFSEQNLYTAHELSQMIPLSGLPIYQKMRQLNAWTTDFLPNASDLPPHSTTPKQIHARLQKWSEFPLRTTLGNKLEQWEMGRKIDKLQTAVPDHHDAQFSATQCKGHFDTHQQRAIHAYQAKTGTNL